MLNSFQTVVILMVISRIDPVNDAGIFVIAYAIGNLMLTIGIGRRREIQLPRVLLFQGFDNRTDAGDLFGLHRF